LIYQALSRWTLRLNKSIQRPTTSTNSVLLATMSIINTMTPSNWRNKEFLSHLRINLLDQNLLMSPKKSATSIKFKRSQPNCLDQLHMTPNKLGRKQKLHRPWIRPITVRLFLTILNMLAKRTMFLEQVRMGKWFFKLIKQESRAM